MSTSYYAYEDARIFRPPVTWSVHRLILVSVGIFVAQLLLEIPSVVLFDYELFGSYQGFYPAHAPGGYVFQYYLGYNTDLFFHGCLWQPFTYQFLHGSLSHLFWNMLLLFFFGPGLERVLGSRQFFWFYISCGSVAVLANLIPDLISFGRFGGSPSVTGASGAVMGVVVAYILTDIERQYYLFPLPVPINGRALILILVVINVLYALGDTTVSVATHFGGMGFGAAYMYLRPRYSFWRRGRRRPAVAARKSAPGARDPRRPEGDDLGNIIDNILKFKEKDWK